MPIISEEHQRRAEAKFKKKEDQAREFSAARMEYDAASRATIEKTARLRVLRLAKEATEAERQGQAHIELSSRARKASVARDRK